MTHRAIGVIVAGCLVCLLSSALTLALASILRRRNILDRPNERSLHTVPVPRGGGWAVLIAFAAGCLVIAPDHAAIVRCAPIIVGVLVLMAVSCVDDIKNLSPLPRFGAQLLVVCESLVVLHGHVFQGLMPAWLDYAASALIWLWFINLFNFMDGIDGLAGAETICISLGLYLIAPHIAAGFMLAMATIGFLIWNWAPAKLFLGDVGSIPIGYVLGALLLMLAERGHWAASLVLPLYFLVDATLTLLWRGLRGEKPWQAHREHFYQLAVQAGRSHATVVTVVALADLVLVVLAVIVAPASDIAALCLGSICVALLLWWMRSAKAA